jgi:hypothetical protein
MSTTSFLPFMARLFPLSALEIEVAAAGVLNGASAVWI